MKTGLCPVHHDKLDPGFGPNGIRCTCNPHQKDGMSNMAAMKDDVTLIQQSGPFTPDWTMLARPKKAEKEMADFQFKGTGWYITKGTRNGKAFQDTMLVMPTGVPDVYQFCVFNNRNPGPVFDWIVNAPVRVDER